MLPRHSPLRLSPSSSGEHNNWTNESTKRVHSPCNKTGSQRPAASSQRPQAISQSGVGPSSTARATHLGASANPNGSPRAALPFLRVPRSVSQSHTPLDSVPVEIPDSESESDSTEDFEVTDIEEDDYDGPPSFSIESSSSPSVLSGMSSLQVTDSDSDDEDSALPDLRQALGLSRASTMPAIGTSRTSGSSFFVDNSVRPSPPPASPALARARSDDSEIRRSPQGPSRRVVSLIPPPAGPKLEMSDDGYFLVAHDNVTQQLMDNYNLSWGVQYELARGVTKGWWQWSDIVQEKIVKLIAVKDQKMAPSYVTEVMLGRKPVDRKIDLWHEVHREQLALLEHDARGLGLMGDWQDQPNWYGGKIQQILRLVPQERADPGAYKSKQSAFHLQLDEMKMGRSYRFARFLGSRRLLHVKVPKSWEVDWASLKQLLTQKLVLCGRVFVAFAVKERKLYFVETDEDYDRDPKPSEGDQYRMSLEELIDWYNPMALNRKQKINKWTTRFDLGLSTSVPILEFSPENIFIEEDICAPHPGGSTPANKIFTDGCGFMNASALIAIGRQLGFTERLTAVQGRVLGAKGVWALHPQHMSLDEPPMIWIRKSQQKIHLVDPRTFGAAALRRLHKAHLIFDLVAPARLWTPSRLSSSTIINLEHNGVPKEIFFRLMEDGLRREVEALTKWEGPAAMRLLWHAVNRTSGVTMQRLQRTATGLQRVLGLTGSRKEEDDSDVEEEEEAGRPETEAAIEMQPGSVATDPAPYSISEGILERLQAGFTPLEDRILYDDVRRLVEETMKRCILEYHIVVPESAEVFIIPDPTGLLLPGEIHFTSTQYLKDPLVDADARTILGEVLIYRNPARVASDVQKVMAVYLPELAQYTDVIVVPVCGEESLPSMLAGGDVDGDTAVCIFDPTIVDAFEQPEMVREPPGLMDNFEPLDVVPTVGAVLQQMEQDSWERDIILRKHLLIGLAETRTGLYSKFHNNTIYQYGYDHPLTVRNAFMFTTILDSRKSGLILKEDVFLHDNKWENYGWKSPLCLGGPDDRSLVRPKRRVANPFILEELLEEGKRIQDLLLIEFDEIGRRVPPERSSDTDLRAPWTDALNVARSLPGLNDELKLVQAHVEACAEEWGRIFRPSPASRFEPKSKYKSDAKRKDESKKKLALAKRFVEGPAGCPVLRALHTLEKVRASYAYIRSPKFAWAMGFQSLCSVKASKRPAKAFTADFANVMSMPASAVRVLSQDSFMPE